MILTVIVIYLIAMLLIGVWASKQIKDDQDYLIGGFRMGILPMTGTYLATFFSALSLLGGRWFDLPYRNRRQLDAYGLGVGFRVWSHHRGAFSPCENGQSVGIFLQSVWFARVAGFRRCGQHCLFIV